MTDSSGWNERYRQGNTPWDTRTPSPELLRVVVEEKLLPCRAIDLGCGTGINTVWLAQQGFDAVGVDISTLAVDRARRRAKEAGVEVEFHAADILEPLQFGTPFNFFFDRGCYHIVRKTDVGRLLQSLECLTAPHARGLILAGNAKELMDPGPPVVTEQEIRSELGRLFEIVWLREFRFDQPNDQPRPLAWSCYLRRKG